LRLTAPSISACLPRRAAKAKRASNGFNNYLTGRMGPVRYARV
jgi:hypothetical protein